MQIVLKTVVVWCLRTLSPGCHINTYSSTPSSWVGPISGYTLPHTDILSLPGQVLTGFRAHTYTHYTMSSTKCRKEWSLSCLSLVSCLQV